MRINANALGNMMYKVLNDLLDHGDLGSTRYGEIDMLDFDEAEIALTIKRQLALKRKRIVIDVKYER
jgi:hypothetical protein